MFCILGPVGGSGLWVVDLGSSNGTFVNGERLSESKVKSKRKALMVGDKLQIGTTILRAMVRVDSNTRPSASAAIGAQPPGRGEVIEAAA